MGVERIRSATIAVLLPVLAGAQSPRPILERTVEVHALQVRLADAMSLVAHDAGFKLSYNAALLNGDSLVDLDRSGTVKVVLGDLVGRHIQLKESGEHIILLDRPTGKHRFRASGKVIDRSTGNALALASVFEVDEKSATVSDAQGNFSVELSGRRDRPPLLISRKDFRDTIVFVGRDGDLGRIALSPVEHLDRLQVRCEFERCNVEDLGVARLLVPTDRMNQAYNLLAVERRMFQASVLPGAGTNRRISGAVVNRYSFNLLAGYSRGLEGLEIGGGVNLEREDVKGVQIAGMANLVGRHVNGVQVAGGINHAMRSVKGLQIAGMGNTVWDTLSGAQVAGGVNVVKGRMRGTQFAGACNVALRDLDGAQVAGGFNVTVQDVNKTQVAGGANYGRNVIGAQVAGGINVVIGSVGGGQVAGGLNLAREVNGGQVAAGMNVAVDTVRGGQVGVLNFGRVVEGGQVGILNFSDTISGASVGILSFAWRGYHRADLSTTDVFPVTLTFRTGTRWFYNLLSGSPAGPDGTWGFGYGFGTEARLGGHGSLNIELAAEHVNERAAWIDAVNILAHLEVLGGFTMGRHVVVTAGPALHYLVSDWRDAEGRYLSTVAPDDPLSEHVQDDVRVQSWLGYRLGLGMRF